jgi:hypothetical protein
MKTTATRKEAAWRPFTRAPSWARASDTRGRRRAPARRTGIRPSPEPSAPGPAPETTGGAMTTAELNKSRFGRTKGCRPAWM